MLNVNNFSHCHDTGGDDLDVTKAVQRLYPGLVLGVKGGEVVHNIFLYGDVLQCLEHVQ